MISGKKRFHPLTGFFIFAVAVCLLNLVFNLINRKFGMSDFKVYYMAAEALINGVPVYGQSFGELSGIYKYSPFILFFFTPFTLAGYSVSVIIHFIILSFAFYFTFIIIRRILTRYFFKTPVRHESLILIFSSFFIMIHMVKELYLGNVNILLLLLSLLALLNYLEQKPLTGSFLLGIVLLTKPFFAFLLIPLVVRKNFKALKWLVLVVLTGLLLPEIILGPRPGFMLHVEWAKAMLLHFDGYPGVNSIDYILRYYFFPGLPGWAGLVIIVLAVIMLVAFTVLNRQKENQELTPGNFMEMNFIFEWFFILALIPDLVRTDSEHFLCTAPLITFILYYTSVNRKYLYILLMIVLFFFFGGNSEDLLGHDFSHQLFIMGFQGLSNLVLILFSVYLYRSFRCPDQGHK